MKAPCGLTTFARVARGRKVQPAATVQVGKFHKNTENSYFLPPISAYRDKFYRYKRLKMRNFPILRMMVSTRRYATQQTRHGNSG
ncbi:MAG: hypothetical protein Q4A06_01760 [Cardiobacteriaceae bacterium]|nr:hypothetical protein [Cardiobacteriaceae bacterium]